MRTKQHLQLCVMFSAWIRIRQTVLCRLYTKIYGNNLGRARADICALNIFVMHNLSKTHLRYNYAMSQNWVATISQKCEFPFVISNVRLKIKIRCNSRNIFYVYSLDKLEIFNLLSLQLIWRTKVCSDPLWSYLFK